MQGFYRISRAQGDLLLQESNAATDVDQAPTTARAARTRSPAARDAPKEIRNARSRR
jgi:hypothetical protein